MFQSAIEQTTTTISHPMFQPTIVSNEPAMTAQPSSAVVTQPILQQTAQPAVVQTNNATNQLSLKLAIDKGNTRYHLSFTNTVCEKGETLEATERFLYKLPGAIYISVARILFIPSEFNFAYYVQVLFVSMHSGTVDSISEFFLLFVTLFRSIVYFALDFKRKYILINTMPLFYTMSRGSGYGTSHLIALIQIIVCFDINLQHETEINICSVVQVMQVTLSIKNVSAARCIVRQQLSSSFKQKYLSPASVTKRKATQIERSTDKAKLAKLTNAELLLNDEQSEETSADGLQKVFQEVDS